MSKIFKEYIHEFAIWTAARASQRAFTSTPIIKAAIEKSGLNVKTLVLNFKSQSAFDKWHLSMCEKLIKSLKKHVSTEKVTYGRVAKIVNIYLKTAYIIPNKGKGNSMKFIHPPIDRILLKELKRELPEIGIKEISWTKFDKGKYFETIKCIEKAKLKNLWEIEKYWKSS